MVYEMGIREAARHTNPTAIGDWPATYDDEVFQARNHAQGFSWGTKIVAACDIVEFSQRLKAGLSEIEWGREIWFMTDIRGVKLAHYHDLTLEYAEQCLADLTTDLMTQDGIWFVDVGLELWESGYAYQWTTDSHARIVSQVLGVTDTEAIRLTRPGRRYNRDLSSHFLELSGFRSTTGDYPGPHGVQYIQCYTIDKAVTYHPDRHGHSSKYITTQLAMTGDPPAFIQSLYNVYKNASVSNDCSARIEVRVPMENAALVFLGVSVVDLRNYIARFRRNIWWSVYSMIVATCTYAYHSIERSHNRTIRTIRTIERNNQVLAFDSFIGCWSNAFNAEQIPLHHPLQTSGSLAYCSPGLVYQWPP